MKKRHWVSIRILFLYTVSGNASTCFLQKDTTPFIGFDIEMGLAISKIQHFESTIKPLSDFMDVETSMQNSAISPGLYCSFGGLFKFSKRFSLEADLSYYVNESTHEYTINHSIEHTLWSEQSWLVNLDESFFQMPIVGILNFGKKDIFSIGLGGYLKYEQSVIMTTKVDVIEYFDKYTVFDPPNTYTIENKKRIKQQFNGGVMAQVIAGIPVNQQDAFFIKLFFQRDFRKIFVAPEIKLDRIGINLGYRCMFERYQ
jgi:hypothetical protein